MKSLCERRAEVKEALARRQFDLLVIGGGITGAGIARDAQMRGMSVALVDKGDFASGTSSRSSKLVHGGLRYLEQFDIKLVLDACRERDLLRRRLAPHLVRPLPFVFPIYAGDSIGRWRLGAAMWLYDALSAFRNVGLHRYLGRERVEGVEPGLRRSGLRGAMLYYDCWTDDARLTLENVISACAHGAVACNHMSVVTFTHDDTGKIESVQLEDQLSGEGLRVKASIVVNATGPWVDRVRSLDEPGCKPLLRPTKGVHLLVPRQRVGNRCAVAMRGVRDRRVMFVIPWQEQALLGTTDTDFEEIPDAVSCDPADVEYILETVNHYFPSASLRESDVVASYAGVRPLVESTSHRRLDPSRVSREEVMIESPSGLISVAGGKLTTYRRMAEQATDLAVKLLSRKDPSRSFAPCKTAIEPLPGARGAGSDGPMPQAPADLPREVWEHIVQTYGARAGELASLLRDPAQRRPVVEGLPYVWGELVYAVASEFAATLEDVLRRRTQIAFRAPDAGLSTACEVVDKLAGLLSWDARARKEELGRYRESLEGERAYARKGAG